MQKITKETRHFRDRNKIEIRHSILSLIITLILFTSCMRQTEIDSSISEMMTVSSTPIIEISPSEQVVKSEAAQTSTSTILPTDIIQTQTTTNQPPITPELMETKIIPSPTWVYHEAGEINVPILAYYHIADSPQDDPGYTWRNDNDIPTESFKLQMELLNAKGFTSISVSMLENVMLNGGDLPANPFILTFDETTQGIYDKAFPVLEEAGFTATLYLKANYIGKERYLTDDQIRELILADWEIGSRGWNGESLANRHDAIQTELYQSKIQLEKLFNIKVQSYSYQQGNIDPFIISRLKEWNYSNAVAYGDTMAHGVDDLYQLHRYEILKQNSKEQFAKILELSSENQDDDLIWDIPPEEITVPVLLYHHVDQGNPTIRYSVSAKNFQEQMNILNQTGYQTITATEFVLALTNGRTIPEKSIVITFDDGVASVFENAYPIMKENDFVGTIYLVGNYIDQNGYMTGDQIQELVSAGWEIGSHSMSHADLTQSENANWEIRDSKSVLETRFDIDVPTFAYPLGNANESTFSKTRLFGYEAAMGLGKFYRHTQGTLFYVSRIEIRNDYSLEEFISFLPW
ncbi:MAG: polysaccharide deacetylase family protein [Bacteroidales bacterium]|nr:polysaccharide deacetylase family protein [Bacteroidales bacterium]